MKKKLIAVLLAAAMLVSLCSCGNTGSGTEAGGAQTQEAGGDDANTSGEKEPVTFTIAVDLHPLTKDEDFNNKEAFKMAEEATGVHIEWMPIATSDAEDKVNIMLASDLPDAFLGTLLNESKISTNIDSFVNLAENDMLRTYAPHVVADYETISGGLDLVTWPDGSIRSLITGKQTSYENDAEGIMFMRKDWLDQLGLDVPTTTDEFYEVLCAFRDNDMNGNGDTTDEIPFLPSQSDWCSKIMNVANPWGIAGTDSSDSSAYLMVKDGQVTGTVNTEEFRDFLEYCNKLVQEGLMDKEIFSQTSEQYHAKINEGVVGCYYTWSPYADMSETEAENWVVVGAMSAPAGSGYTKTGSQDKFAGNRTGFAITTACEAPERLLEWWDYLSSSTEIKYTCRLGAQGGAWDIDEEGNVYEKTPDDLTDDFNIENYKYTYGMVDVCPLILKDETTRASEEESYTSWYREQCVDVVHDYCLPVENQLPIRFVDTEKMNERTFIETELFSAIQTFIADSVINGIDDTSWNAYLEQLDALQYNEWLQWYQDFVDGAF